MVAALWHFCWAYIGQWIRDGVVALSAVNAERARGMGGHLGHVDGDGGVFCLF